VTSQSHGIWHWNLIRLGIVPFVVFVIAITAELNRPPFDVVEAESELVGDSIPSTPHSDSPSSSWLST